MAIFPPRMLPLLIGTTAVRLLLTHRPFDIPPAFHRTRSANAQSRLGLSARRERSTHYRVAQYSARVVRLRSEAVPDDNRPSGSPQPCENNRAPSSRVRRWEVSPPRRPHYLEPSGPPPHTTSLVHCPEIPPDSRRTTNHRHAPASHNLIETYQC